MDVGDNAVDCEDGRSACDQHRHGHVVPGAWGSLGALLSDSTYSG